MEIERVGEKAAARQQLTCCRAIPSSFTARCGGTDGTLTVLANGSPFLYLLGSGSRVSRTVPQSLCDLRTATVYRVMWQCYFLEFIMFIFTMACKWHTSSSLQAQCYGQMFSSIFFSTHVQDKCFHYSTLVQVVVRFASSVLHVSPLLGTTPLNTCSGPLLPSKWRNCCTLSTVSPTVGLSMHS